MIVQIARKQEVACYARTFILRFEFFLTKTLNTWTRLPLAHCFAVKAKHKVINIYKRKNNGRITFFSFCLVGSKTKWRRTMDMYLLLIIFPEINL